MAIQLTPKPAKPEKASWMDVLKQSVASGAAAGLGAMVAAPVQAWARREIREKPAQEEKARQASIARVSSEADGYWRGVENLFLYKVRNYGDVAFKALDQTRTSFQGMDGREIEAAKLAYRQNAVQAFQADARIRLNQAGWGEEQIQLYLDGVPADGIEGLSRAQERGLNAHITARNSHYEQIKRTGNRHISVGASGKITVSAGTPEERAQLRAEVDKQWEVTIRRAVDRAVAHELYLHEREGLVRTPAEAREFALRVQKRAEAMLGVPAVPADGSRGSFIYKDGQWIAAPPGDPTREMSPLDQDPGEPATTPSQGEAEGVVPPRAEEPSAPEGKLIQGTSGDPSRGAYASTGEASVASVTGGADTIGVRTTGPVVESINRGLFVLYGGRALDGGQPSNKYGGRTYKLVRRFQDENGLSVTGIVDQATARAMAKEIQKGAYKARAQKHAPAWLTVETSRVIRADQPIETIAGYPAGTMTAGGPAGAATPPTRGEAEARYEPLKPGELRPLLETQEEDDYRQSAEAIESNIQMVREVLYEGNLSGVDRKFFNDYIKRHGELLATAPTRHTQTSEDYALHQETRHSGGLRSRMLSEGEGEEVPSSVENMSRMSQGRKRLVMGRNRQIKTHRTARREDTQEKRLALEALTQLASRFKVGEADVERFTELMTMAKRVLEKRADKELTQEDAIEMVKEIRKLVDKAGGASELEIKVLEELAGMDLSALPETVKQMLEATKAPGPEVPEKFQDWHFALLNKRLIELFASDAGVGGVPDTWRLKREEIEDWLNTRGMTLDQEAANADYKYIGGASHTGQTNLDDALQNEALDLLDALLIHVTRPENLGATLDALGESKPGTSSQLDQVLSEGVRSIIRRNSGRKILRRR